MAEFTMLYSGSSGNSAFLREEDKYLLVDMGKSSTLTQKKLQELNAPLSSLMGILITHEHSDHIAGLNVFLKKYNIPIYSKKATLNYLYDNNLVPQSAILYDIGDEQADVGGFGVKSFSTPHDALDCTGYRITTPKGKTIALATDLGYISPEIYNNLTGADFVNIESNYDYDMLFNGPYPYYLKKRIDGNNGHLKNEDCAKTIAELHKNGCEKFMLCHISDKNNTMEHALNSVRNEFIKNDIIPNKSFKLTAARRNEISPIIEI